MDLREHGQNQLHEKEEISGAEPGYTSIAHLFGQLRRHPVQILLNFLLLPMIAIITILLLLHVL